MGIRPCFFVLALLYFCCPLVGQQRDTIFVPPVSALEFIEDYFQNIEGEGDFDFNALFEELAFYQNNPINLNTANEDELRALRLLSDVQIINLISYRIQTGPLLAIYELQVIPGFDMAAIRRILPFVRVNSQLDDYNLPIGEMIASGKNELFLRWQRILENQKGYQPADDPTTNRYLGDPNQLYLRFRHTYSNRLSWGITAEKDRGETFFKGSNTQGFDYYSAHFFLRDYKAWLPAVALGDFNISFGQGLVLFSGFGGGKSAFATQVKRSSRTLMPYASVNEALFMRGAGVTLAPTDQIEVTTFASYRRRDGNLTDIDTAFAGDQLLQRITSFNESGLHRTPSEVADEGAVGQFTTGGNIIWSGQQHRLGVNLLYNQLDKALDRTPQPYNQFYFSGDQLFNASFDYSYIYRNFNFFGETAWSDNGAMATLNGLLIGLDRKVDLAIVYRRYARDYQALNADAFAETGGTRNEEGIYVGLEIRPAERWTISTYFDQWRHPWLRFNLDSPSTGYEYRGRITYEQRRTLRMYLEARQETKYINRPNNETAFNEPIPRQIFQTRLHIARPITKALELRTRLDWGFFDNEAEDLQTGFSVLQDILFKPLGSPLSFTARYALFDTDGYDIRFYHYENNLLNTFSIPAYYNRGSRFYLNVRYRPLKAFTIEGRLAQTFWSNRDRIGSGLEEIDGPVRTEAALQIKYQFSR